MIIVIAGPTAVGKTKLSIELAKRLNGEVINSDSTQVYREMNIGTAKVTEEEKEGIPHHLFDIRNIDEDYTVYDYQKDARRVIDDILKRGKTPILAGGTGLYIKAALFNYEFKDEDTKYNFSNLSNEEVYNKLKELDPNTDIHINNRKRVERALTYCLNNNDTISNNTKGNELLYDTVFIGLTTDRDFLYKRINMRVDVMVKNGLIEEAKYFYDKNIRSKAVMTPICYKELFEYFDGHSSLEEALDLIRQRSRKYAKRQYTWFKHQLPVKWFDVDFDNFDNTVNCIFNYIKSIQK
jgi:tRNA dimethylallyltransferase